MKRNLVVIGAVVAGILVGAGFLGYQRTMASSAASTVKVQTATVTRGTLASSVAASGNVTAPNTAALAFSSSGKVAQVAVQVGDKVTKGQLLMRLDTTDLDLALQTAQASLASAQASYDSTQASLQYSLKTAQANLASAQASYDSAKATDATNLDQLIVVKMALDEAKVTLQQAQAAYDGIAWRSDASMMTQATTLQTAQAGYNSALASYNITAKTINDTSLRTAQASLDNAKNALEQAQKNIDTSTRTAQATLDNANLAVEQAKRNLENASLYATMNGLVSAVNFNAGDTASGTAVSIVDASNLQVSATIAEVDMSKVKVGETAEMTLDALTGKTYTAAVIAFSPVGTVSSGVVNYPVTLLITNADDAIRAGMTANLAIETERRDNVLVIPTKAVRTQGTQKVVSILVNGKTVQTAVTTGLSNDTSIEITGGLQEGDVVVLNQTTTSTSAQNAGGGMNLLGGITGGPAGGPPPN